MNNNNDLLDLSNTKFLEKVFELKNFDTLSKWYNENKLQLKDEKKRLLFKIISNGMDIIQRQRNKIKENEAELLKKQNEITQNNKKIEEILKIAANDQNNLIEETKIKSEKQKKLYEDKIIFISNDLMTKLSEIESNFNQKLIEEKKEWNKNLIEEKKKMNVEWNEKLIEEKKKMNVEWNEKLIEEKTKINIEWNKKLNEEKISFKINMDLKLKVSNFNQNLESLMNHKRLYFSNLKLEYLEKEIDLNTIDKNKLTLLCNDFYCFRNIAIYRKIANVLLKKIIDIYLYDLETEVTKNNKKLIKAKKRSSHYKDLNDIISFLFFIKNKSSLILHFKEDIKFLIDNLNTQEPFSLKITENLKSSKDFLFELTKNCTYQKLISVLNTETPLLFLGGSDNSKEKLEKKIKTQINSLNKKIEEESFNDYSKLLEDLNNQKLSIENLIKEYQIYDDNSDIIIKDFNNGVENLKKEEKSFEEIKKFNNERKSIINEFMEILSNKKDVKKVFFTIIDFINLYNRKDFTPYEICKNLFNEEEIVKTVNFFSEDEKDYAEYLEKSKNKS